MAHGLVDEVGGWWNRNIRNPIAEGYFGYHRGPDWMAEASLGMGSEMRTDLGATTPGEINDIIAKYESGGELPEGRLGDIIRLSEEYTGAITGEFDIKQSLADLGVDTAEAQKTLLSGEGGKIDEWLEGNLFNLERGKESKYQTSNLIGPTREGTMAREKIGKEAERKYGEFETKMELADIGIEKAGLAGDLLEYDESKAMVKAEQDRLSQINAIKDLIYELETQELQFG